MDAPAFQIPANLLNAGAKFLLIGRGQGVDAVLPQILAHKLIEAAQIVYVTGVIHDLIVCLGGGGLAVVGVGAPHAVVPEVDGLGQQAQGQNGDGDCQAAEAVAPGALAPAGKINQTQDTDRQQNGNAQPPDPGEAQKNVNIPGPLGGIADVRQPHELAKHLLIAGLGHGPKGGEEIGDAIENSPCQSWEGKDNAGQQDGPAQPEGQGQAGGGMQQHRRVALHQKIRKRHRQNAAPEEKATFRSVWPGFFEHTLCLHKQMYKKCAGEQDRGNGYDIKFAVRRYPGHLPRVTE